MISYKEVKFCRNSMGMGGGGGGERGEKERKCGLQLHAPAAKLLTRDRLIDKQISVSV